MQPRISSIIIVTLSLCFCFFLVSYPQEGLQAAVLGISIWWDVLFPALFPFLVIAEMLLGFGVVHFMGVLLDPLMRPLFRVPGAGGFVMAMGFASGYPIGAKLSAQLWEQKLISREEGERLIAFSTSSDPIFLIGAVSVGFFHQPQLAGILALSHYGAGLIVGLLMKYHKSNPSASLDVRTASASFSLHRAFQAMHDARLLDGRPMGVLIKQSIQTSLKLVFVIGGLVVFFSVMLEMLTASNMIHVISLGMEALLRLASIPDGLSAAMINGIFEVTLGAKFAGEAGNDIGLLHKIAIAAFILSWGGLSVHAQIISLISQTNMRYLPFFIARLLHGVLAALLVYALGWFML